MEIIVEQLVDGKVRQLKTVHGNEEIIWNAETYNRSNFQSPETVFDNINGFLDSLGEQKQKGVAKAYREIYEALYEISDTNRLHSKLQESVAKLYSHFTFEELKKWSYLHGEVEMPPDLKVECSPEDLKSDRSVRLTYLREDYYDLAVLSIYLKLMVPIFGEYIQRSKDQIGTQFKEQGAMTLLSKSGFFDLTAVKRLQTYIEAYIEREEVRNSAVFGGLGTSELPEWLLSRVIVRRVAVSEVGVGENVMSNVYHTIGQQINSLDKTFRGRISGKKPPHENNGGSEEDNVSVAESYKIKQQISDGDLTVLSIYTENYRDMASKIDPTVPVKRVNHCVGEAQKHSDLFIQQHQIVLTQWTLSKALSPRGIPLLKKPALLRSIGVTQALLWHWGFGELAALLVADPVMEYGQPATFTPTRLSKNHIEDFSQRFPHWRRTGSKEQNQRHVNVACRAIDTLAMQVVKTDWKVRGPKELLSELQLEPGGSCVVPADVRHQLADLLIRINENKKNQI